MLICKNCNHLASNDLNEWIVNKELLWGDFGRPVGEYNSVHCPECGSDDIEDAIKCDVCGEFYNPDEACIVEALEVQDGVDPSEWASFEYTVCPDCCDEYFSDGHVLRFNLSDSLVTYRPEVGKKFRVGKYCGVCINHETEQQQEFYLMYIEEEEL